MEIKISEEFIDICKEIHEENKSKEGWAETESDDMFQTENYCGGYDADEEAFCFSFYDNNGSEYWFQLNLDEIEKVIGGTLNALDGRSAEH